MTDDPIRAMLARQAETDDERHSLTWIFGEQTDTPEPDNDTPPAAA